MESLRVIPMGGLGEFGMNMMLLEYGGSVIAIDCGVMFPGADLLGIDLVVPDVSYLTDRGKRPEALIFTHAHEDHIGAAPYILKQLPMPVYGTPLTLGFLRHKLREHNLENSTELREITPGRRWSVGPFTLEGIQVTHSLIQCVALAIETPVGLVLHTGDFKIDNTPMKGERFDFHSFAACGEKGVLLLLSDSTNVERAGFTPSEREVGKNLREVFHSSRGRIFVTTFSSNIPRIQQVADLAADFDRKLVVSGRSMIHNTQMASDMGVLDLQQLMMTEDQNWEDVAEDRLCFLSTGSQGEPFSVLHRIAFDEHRTIKLHEGDTVVLSAKFIPGNERAIGHLINHLYRRGASVHYEKVSEIHVSGHASQEELKIMLRLTRPRYFVPIHGEYRNLVKHIEIARGVGLPKENCFLLEDGDVLELTSDSAHRIASVSSGRVFVDGKGVGDVEDIVLRDRRHLSEDGMVLVVMAIHQQSGELVAGPDLVSRGFMRAEDPEGILEEARNSILHYLDGCSIEARTDSSELKEEIRVTLRRFFRKRLQRRPVVLPFIMEM